MDHVARLPVIADQVRHTSVSQAAGDALRVVSASVNGHAQAHIIWATGTSPIRSQPIPHRP